MTRVLVLATLLAGSVLAKAQSPLPDSCALDIGVNLAGVFDWGTELPFVDRMRNAREWYTKDVGNPADPFDSGAADSLSYRPDGYPTHVPQALPGRAYPVEVATIWASTDGWLAGTYTILFDGTGELSLWGSYDDLTQVAPGHFTFDLDAPLDGVLELRIRRSEAGDPIRNIRVLQPGSADTYLDEPFNPVWLERVRMFRSVRFMDWGSTNNWGRDEATGWDTPELFDWSERAQPDHYTWATSKGVPYETMVRLMNDLDLDGWVCVPHRAGDAYIDSMARLFHEHLEPERHLTVEYSNETWNWIFGQAAWCQKYGALATGLSWPESTVAFAQNAIDRWTEAYGVDTSRLTRAVGVQTGWLDVARRVSFGMRPGSFDAVAPSFYFGLDDAGDAALDALGARATAADVARYARANMPAEQRYIRDVKTAIADPLSLKLAFYEGGQHLTPQPFGQEPTYAQALLDVQRDTAMYHLYREWFDFLRTLQSGDDPLQLMAFSLVTGRSARFGSWGMLETMDQDTALIPAPKFRAVAEEVARNCGGSITGIGPVGFRQNLRLAPNPTAGVSTLIAEDGVTVLGWALYDLAGRQVRQRAAAETHVDLTGLPAGLYELHVQTTRGASVVQLVKHE